MDAVSGSFVVNESEAYALGPGEGRVIDLGDFAVTVKASEKETGGVVSVLENEEPPGFGPPIHVHHDCAEAFYVLSGEYIMNLEGREVVCPAGSFIFIPQGARHGFRVGDVHSRKLNFYFPASMVGYFDELAEALREDSVSESALADIAETHRMEIVGPPSERYA
jgi:mannose-6-phosphate isomerase-like protein (cupin superfamily)